jgi:PPM family protein phosphatase
VSTAVAWHVGTATDAGRERKINEDRVLADEANGLFLVADGLGGHAAGEEAADLAVSVVSEEMSRRSTNLEIDIRHAITEANNRIHEAAQSRDEWRGMACVLTMAVVQNEQVTVGHVGDSRLYLVWNGNLKKVTSDHSPVGEQEDRGEITEEQAMSHPRRNEIFRDVGSHRHHPDDPQFIEIRRLVLRPDAALLLCSDGLSDVLTSARIRSIVESYNGNPKETSDRLVAEANTAGGHDNISVIFIAGPQFLGGEANRLQEIRPRHTSTRVREAPAPAAAWSPLKSFLWLLGGMLLGIALWLGGQQVFTNAQRTAPNLEPRVATPPATAVKLDQKIDPADPRSLATALGAARDGETIVVPPGRYLGPLVLRDHVSIKAAAPGKSTVVADAGSMTDPGLAIVGRGVSDVRISGLRIAGDELHPLRIGVLLSASSVELDDVDVSGAIEAGVRIEGASPSLLLGSNLHGNLGTGLSVAGSSAARIAGNHISENGRLSSGLRAGVELFSGAHPVLENNVITGNGRVGISGLPADLEAEVKRTNILDHRPVVAPKPAPAAADPANAIPKEPVERPAAPVAVPPQ